MLNTVRLRHTVWYSHKKKIIRMNIKDLIPEPGVSLSYTAQLDLNNPVAHEIQNIVKVHSLSKTISTYGEFLPELEYSFFSATNPEAGSVLNKDSWNTRVQTVWNEIHKAIDIILSPNAKFNVDGELCIDLTFVVYHGPENEFTEDLSSFNNSKKNIKIIIPFRSHENESTFVSTNNPAYGFNDQTTLRIVNDTSKSVVLDDDPVVYEFEVNEFDVTNEFTTFSDVKDMIASTANGNSNQDQYTIFLEGDNLVLTKENDSTYRKEINLAKYHDEVSGEPLNVEDLKRDILSIVDGKIPNVETLKSDILGEVDTKIATNNQTFKSTVMSEVDSKIPDVSVVKSEILNEVNPRLLDKETFKQEILSSIPAPANYTLTMEGDNLVLSKEGDDSYRKVINLSKYHDEVSGQTVDVEQIKRDILASITIPNVETIKEEIRQSLPTIPNYTLMLNENTLTLGKEGDSEYSKTIDLSKYVNGPAIDTEQLKQDIIAAIHIPDENAIKQNILSEVNPKLIDKDIFKNEVLAAIPSQSPVSPSKLVSEPSITNGVLKFNIETDAPTVDFTNEFYTKAKVDELLRSSSNTNIPNNNKLISGSGRPDATDHPNNNAPIGTIFIDVNTTNGASVWYRNINKWEVIVGDTGWKRLNAINLFAESGIFIRRINNIVYIKFGGLEYDLFGHVALQNAISRKDTNYIRLVEVNNIPEGFRTDNAYVGTSISDYITPGKILGSYYVSPQSDSNYIKLFYNESVPNTDQKDLRLQPGTWPIGNSQPWPTL